MKKPSTEKQQNNNIDNKKYADLIKKIETMSIKELNDFVQTIQDHFNIKPVVMMAGAESSGKEKDKENVNVVIVEVGQSKIALIKALGAAIGKGLMDAKKMLEKLPTTVVENKPILDAENLKKQLEEAGATVELK